MELNPHEPVISLEHVWASYGLQIQQLLRGERGTAVPAADDIDEADVPF